MEMVWVVLGSIALALGSVLAGLAISLALWALARRLGHPGWCLPLASALLSLPFVLPASAFLDMAVVFGWIAATCLWFGSRSEAPGHAA